MRTAGRVAWAVAVAASVIGAAGGVALAKDAASRPSPARSAGVVMWAAAAARSPDARSLTVLADVEAIARRAGCDSLTARPTVSETATAVRIRVEILDHPAPPETICAASLQSRLTVPVHLRAPLGERRLIDGSDGGTRRIHVPLS